MTPEEFRRHGHQLVDWLADYLDRVKDHPVQPVTRPGEVKALLPLEPPEEAEPFESIVADLDRVITPHLTYWRHPRFFGYFPANSLPAGALADLVSTGLGVLGLSWQASPALTEVEEVVVDWFRALVGLSSAWSGVINDTASTSTLVALICARERASNYGLFTRGLQAESAPLVVYASDSSHSSVEKAVLLAGFGKRHLRLVTCDDAFAMRADRLAALIAEDRARGLRPCAVVATVGSTATTALDPIAAIGDIARAENLWLHVDAAMAGSAMIVPECRWMWSGVEAADSLVINPHKWLGVPFDCSLQYVRDEAHLLKVMSTNPSYLRSAADGVVRNLRDTSIPLGRRFRALKLWFCLREQGAKALRARVRRDLANAQVLARLVAGASHWRVIAPVVLQTVCIRHEPPGLPESEIDAHNRAWAEQLNRSGEAFVSAAQIGGHWMVRVSIGSLDTEWPDIERAWAAMRRAAEAT